jgi:hypothetical protein
MSVRSVGADSAPAGPSSGGGGSLVSTAGPSAIFVLIISIITMYMGGSAQRVALTATLAMMFFAVISYSPRAGIPMMLVFLSGVGFLKRYLIPVFGYTTLDPLLLVGPFVASIFFMNRILMRLIPLDTLLSKLVAALIVIMLLEALNPLQGGIAVGMSGLLFFLVPLLWFYCGRSFGTQRTCELVLKTVVLIAVVGGIYGLYQQFVGFSDVEKEWIELTKNDQAQYLTNGVMRVFSFFSSFAEYVHFLCMGAIIAFAVMLRRNRFAGIPLVFLLCAVMLSSSRGGVVGGLFGISLVWAVQGRSPRLWVPRLVIAAVIGVAALYIGLHQVQEASIENDTAEVLLQHQAEGLLAPADKKASTGGGPEASNLQSIVWGFKKPLGIGLGATTIGASKFGGVSNAVGVESDLGNMFISCGAVGGMLYAFTVGWTCWRLVRSWIQRRDFASLCIFATLAGSIGLWTGQAQYAATMLSWFLIGAIDRRDAQEQEQERRRQEEIAGPTLRDLPTFQSRILLDRTPGGLR